MWKLDRGPFSGSENPKKLFTVLATPETALITALILDFMPLTKLSIRSLPHFIAIAGMFLKNSSIFRPAFGTVSVKNLTKLETTLETVFLTLSHTLMTASRNPSLVFQRVIIAATSPPINVTTKTMGFAFMAAFISHCAIVAPSFAF